MAWRIRPGAGVRIHPWHLPVLQAEAFLMNAQNQDIRLVSRPRAFVTFMDKDAFQSVDASLVGQVTISSYRPFPFISKRWELCIDFIDQSQFAFQMRDAAQAEAARNQIIQKISTL